MKQLFFLLSALILGAVGMYSQNYNSEFFPIGVWSIKGDFRSADDFLFNVETAAAYHHTSFQNLKAEGFNSVFLSYDPIGYTLDTILDIAEMNDMKVISSMQHLYEVISQSNDQEVTDQDIITAIQNDSIQRLKQSPAVLGYYLYDEPLPGWIDFNVLQNARNILTQMTADAPHPVLSCWNDEQYMNELDSYLNLDVIMMDAYPFEDGDEPGDMSDYMPSYFSEQEDPIPFSDYINLVRLNHCEEQNKPLWVVFQAFGDLESPENGGYWRQVYPKEIRLQVYTAIMQGAKGIWYFLYESEFPYLLGMLDVSGQPTQRLTEAVNINYEIQSISDILLKLRMVNNVSAVTTDSGEVKLHKDITAESNNKYIICVNTDIDNLSQPEIQIDKSNIGYEVHSVMDMRTGEYFDFTDTGEHIIIHPDIPAASGRLIKLSAENMIVSPRESTGKPYVYPNPANNILYINYDHAAQYYYAIFDYRGRKIKTGSLDNNMISVTDLHSGLYHIKLFNDMQMYHFRIMKK